MGWVEVGYHAIAYVLGLVTDVPYLLASACIDHAYSAPVRMEGLKAKVYFHAGAIGVYVGEVGLVGVSQSGRP